MYKVTKEISFCYGHRLMHHAGKCRHLHGHSARAAITIAADELDRQGMVCDFSDIDAAARQLIDEQFDHNMLLHRDDPALPWLRQNNERHLVLDEHPTAEALAKMIYRHMQAQGYRVVQVAIWETATAHASYSE
ncbi:6-pyruvoyl trahydropterin synthase family protein [Methylogaea oryzae]|uniref:6-carboxy-5,6,7,8-tetrahydropterin synthase n=1 Tax=Methylogaea oryzae TaxID=1295382 RepID=A0A8D4VMX6_9GAMM|nr:6-carboxytetrahydropterin synthase [Methylogaea oryzae]BBL70447.1 6-carboxy-5,6,7,8-tetrahydropterin synthase [Methylogaea oryzae]